MGILAKLASPGTEKDGLTEPGRSKISMTDGVPLHVILGAAGRWTEVEPRKRVQRGT